MVTHRQSIRSGCARLLLRPSRVKSADDTPKCLHQCPLPKGRIFLAAVAFAGMLSLFAAVHCTAQESGLASLSDEDLREEMARVRKEADTLANSPEAPAAWKELRAADEELNQINRLYADKNDVVRRRVESLINLPEVQEWSQRVSKSQQRYAVLQQEEIRRAKEAGSALYRDRHKELAKLAPPDTPQLRRLGLDLLGYPRVDGSTSTLPLSALIACRCFGAPYAWTGRHQGPQPHNRYLPNMGDNFIPRVREQDYELVEFTLLASTAPGEAESRLAYIINTLLTVNASTHDAYVNLIEGRSDIGLLARKPSPDELALAQSKNVELDLAPFALDAFVFIVNEENPVTNLTVAQIRDIYTDRIKNWKDVGGPDAPITAYQREKNSGSEELMRELVMKELPFEHDNQTDPRPSLIVYSMVGPFLVLSRDKQGLAYSVNYYERYMAGSARTRPIAIEGVEPTPDAIRGRRYPLTTEAYIVTRKGLAPDTPTAKLRDWLLSPEGQSIVRESGYVPFDEAKE